jgi:hypothetical protein
MMGRWIWAHDAEQYAYDNYDAALSHLLTGTPFRNTNIPPGYDYIPWTIQELFELINARKPIEFEGDWL